MRAAKIVYTKPLSRAKKPLKEAKEQFKNKTNPKTAQTSLQKQMSPPGENPTVAKQKSIKHRKG